MIYNCASSGHDMDIEAESAEQAAQEYVDGGDWGPLEKTTWINVYVTDEDGQTTRVKVTLDPDEPPCEEEEHEWVAPLSLVGGCKESPGVHGSGGGVTIHEVCRHCGCGKLVNTWDYDPETGEQGLESVRYTKNEFSVDEVEEALR